MYLPESTKHKPPYHAVLICCGHSVESKAAERNQRLGALLARNGLAAFCFDPPSQGERAQSYRADGKLEPPRGSEEHTLMSVAAIPLGHGAATQFTWDGMRCLDYLDARPEIVHRRYGCTGSSGGGTQTTYLMALDTRVWAAVPVVSVTTSTEFLHAIGPDCGEQNIFGQLRDGLDIIDFFLLGAPRPRQIGATTRDMFPISGAVLGSGSRDAIGRLVRERVG